MLVRLRVLLWCSLVAAVAMRWLQRRMRVVMLVVPKQRRLVLRRLQRRDRMPGILANTRVGWRRLALGKASQAVVVGLCRRMRAAWV